MTHSALPVFMMLLDRVLPLRTQNHIAHFEGVLGTSLEIQVLHSGDQAGIQAEAAALSEIERLEQIFSRYLPESEFNRWQQKPERPQRVSLELAVLLESSEYWRRQTNNAFHPAADALGDLWRKWAGQGTMVPEEKLEAILCEMHRPLWHVDRHFSTACKYGSLSTNLNSIAKGFIIDRAVSAAARTPGIYEVLINIGGDIRHFGDKSLTCAITNPFAPAENSEPIDVVTICNHGLATSGNYRRGFQVGERRFSHLFDPRTGHPVEHTVSVSVIADSATAADVLATAFSVLPIDESLALADSLPNIGCLIVSDNGNMVSNSIWEEHSTKNCARC